MDLRSNATTTSATNRAEAERLLGISEKLLENRDLTGAREFAVLAQETEPLLEGSDQILAVTDVLLAADKRVNNNRADWYSILQIGGRTDDVDLIKKNYRRLALLLHPDKNKFPHSDSSFQLVADAWAILSDETKKYKYDSELTVFTKVDLAPKSTSQSQFQYQQDKLPVRRSARAATGSGASPSPGLQGSGTGGVNSRTNSETHTFWTACPYCYILYQYPKTYEDCCLRCQSCRRAFHAAVIPSLPPRVPGKEAYYCCWGFFPLGFSIGYSETRGMRNNNYASDHKNNPNSGFPNWMPPIFSATPAVSESQQPVRVASTRQRADDMSDGSASPDAAEAAATAAARVAAATAGAKPISSAPRKRGRPRKNPL